MFERKIRGLVLGLILFIVVFISNDIIQATTVDNIISDSALKANVNNSLGRTNLNASISREDIKKLTKLSLDDTNGIIISLSGLEFAKNLEIITTQNKNVETGFNDLRPLYNLDKLKIISISGKFKINDFYHLKGLTNLEELELFGEGVVINVSGINNLTKLTKLNISTNNNIDLREINYLNNLKSLIFNTANTYTLDILNSGIHFDNFTNLNWLKITRSNLTDLSMFKNLKKLTYLSITNSRIKDLSHIENLENLDTITLHDNQIESFDALTSLKKLTTINANTNYLTNIDFVSKIPTLKYIFLDNNKIISLPNFSKLSSLAFLSLSNNEITNLNNINTITKKIEFIDLSSNYINNFDMLKNFESNYENIFSINATSQHLDLNNYLRDDIVVDKSIKIDLLDHTGNEFTWSDTLNNKENIFTYNNGELTFLETGNKDYFQLEAKYNTNSILKYSFKISANVLAKIEFVSNESSNTMPSKKLMYLETISLPANSFINNDKEFIGWATSQDKANRNEISYFNQGKFTQNSRKNTTLYASYRSINTNSLKIEYFGNDHTTGQVLVDEKEYKINDLAIIKSQHTLAKQGYLFSGWNTKADGSGIMYQANNSILICENLKLYAMWARQLIPHTYKLTYNGNQHSSGNVPIDNNFYYLNENARVLNSNTLQKVGYIFDRWNTSADGSGTYYEINSEIKINKDTTLFAIWKKDILKEKFHLIYVSNEHNDGNIPIDLKEYGLNSEAVIKSSNLKRNGYDFVGWKTLNSEDENIYNEKDKIIITNNTILYAVWLKKSDAIDEIEKPGIENNENTILERDNTKQNKIPVTGNNIITFVVITLTLSSIILFIRIRNQRK